MEARRNGVVYQPPKLPRPTSCYFAGWRLAWFYRDGTVVRTRRGTFVNTHDYQFDSWPWWERQDRVSAQFEALADAINGEGEQNNE